VDLQKIFNNNNKKEEAERGDTKCIKYKVENEAYVQAHKTYIDAKHIINQLNLKRIEI
jgi:hypothetical protein